jgi:CHASE2 domain-containing sensor protein
MANIQKRGDYKPRRQREREAYRLVVGGVAAGGLGVLTLVLAVVGTVSGVIPVLLLAAAGGCAWRFRRLTGR